MIKRGRGRPRKVVTDDNPAEEYSADQVAESAGATAGATEKQKVVINPLLQKLTVNDIRGLFDVALKTVYVWVDNGMPKNAASTRGKVTFDLYKVVKWKIQNDAERDIKERIDLQRLRKLELENDDSAGLKIDRTEMDDILKSRALSLRSFFERGLPMNRAQRAMKSVEELVALDYEFAQSAMEAYMGTRNWKQELQ